MKNYRMFISLEGPEGSGKTTISKMISNHLNKKYDVLITREPGGTEFGKRAREILLADSLASKEAELLLFWLIGLNTIQR